MGKSKNKAKKKVKKGLKEIKTEIKENVETVKFVVVLNESNSNFNLRNIENN